MLDFGASKISSLAKGLAKLNQRLKSAISFVTLLAFLSSQAAIAPAFSSEVAIPSTFSVDLPRDLGNISALHAGASRTVIHIQTAHGNYEAQKKIQAILHYI